MKKPTQFNKGWWNCFGSFVSEMHDNNPDMAVEYAKRIIKGAGVHNAEIGEAIKSGELPDQVAALLAFNDFNSED